MPITPSSTSGSSLLHHRSSDWRDHGPVQQFGGWAGAAMWVVLTAAAAIAGAMASSQAPDFYAALQKPAWAPPAWLFGPVWSVLYVLMACGAVMVHRRLGSRPQARTGLTLYALALVPNALWSWTFFHWHLGAVSLGVIGLLWCLVLATAVVFRRVHPASSVLLLPLLVWISFAMALNAALLSLNPGLL